ncbi:MAG: antitoxin [Polaromonas sp.]|nr:antitoxin [Polaromonas sp.]
MNAVLSPMVSEFETQEQENSYTMWLREKYAASLADTRSNVSHDDVMAKARVLLDQKKAQRAVS